MDRDSILNNSETLFTHLLGSLPIKRYIKSPLRDEDTTASFTLYYYKNTLWFKDWGGKYGNVIDYVMLLNNLSFKEAVGYIESLPPMAYIKPPPIKESVTTIEYKEYSTFTKTDAMYWTALGVSSKLLRKEGVKSAMLLRINGMPFYAASAGDPIYIYTITHKGEERCKTYIPRGPKEIKFRNNFPNVSRYVHGLNTLDKKATYVIITKSVKDELVLKGMGFNAISTQGEDINIPAYLIRWLRAKYSNLFILYDNDFTKPDPYKFSKKHARIHNLNELRVPEVIQATDIAEVYLKDARYAKYFIEINLNKYGKLSNCKT